MFKITLMFIALETISGNFLSEYRTYCLHISKVVERGVF